MHKNYLTYLYKNRRVAILFFGIVYLSLLFLSDLSFSRTATWYSWLVKGAGILGFLLTYALPVLQFSFVHRKRSVDTYFALPVSRHEQLHSNLFFAWSIPALYYTIALLLAYLFVVGKVSLGALLLVWVVGLGLFLAMVLINSVIYLLANNQFDGFVLLAAYTALPILVFVMQSSFFDAMVIGPYSWEHNIGIYISPIYLSGSILDVTANRVVHQFAWGGLLDVGLLVVYSGLAYYGLQKHFVHRESERAEQLSDQLFAYPFIINVYAFALLCTLAFSGIRSHDSLAMPFFYLILFVVYIVAFFIYQRKISLKPKYFLMYLLGIVLSLGIAYAAWQTRGFGISDGVTIHDGSARFVTYNYDVSVEKENLEKQYEGTYVDKLPVNLHFEMVVDTDKEAQYLPFINIMEQARRDSINAFYQEEETLWSGHIWIGKSNSRNYTERSFNYPLVRPLSEEVLKEINQYTTVEVYDYETDEVYSLDAYLKKRGN